MEEEAITMLEDTRVSGGKLAMSKCGMERERKFLT